MDDNFREEFGPNSSRYVDVMMGQIDELCAEKYFMYRCLAGVAGGCLRLA
jgi:hypothetical protein